MSYLCLFLAPDIFFLSVGMKTRRRNLASVMELVSGCVINIQTARYVVCSTYIYVYKLVCEVYVMCTWCVEPMVMAELPDISLNCLQPHPLPMPAYGGYYAPLSQFLPTSGSLPTPPYQRSVTYTNSVMSFTCSSVCS